MDPKRLVKRGDTIRVCGRMLVETLSLLCNGEYYDPSETNNVGRRNLAPPMIDPYQNWVAVALSPRNRDEVESHTSSDQLPTSPLYKRFQPGGVVDECCRKPCSPSTLLSYCRTD
ncbi:insulin-like [Argiope bruennichi]|uniref:insulin-like n=1 Tax=Argiope bruennichi TaxID=94029 RepID=UPI002495772A|nr:insulin-like [Argiope bruennichi]